MTSRGRAEVRGAKISYRTYSFQKKDKSVEGLKSEIVLLLLLLSGEIRPVFDDEAFKASRGC